MREEERNLGSNAVSQGPGIFLLSLKGTECQVMKQRDQSQVSDGARD